MVMEGIGTMFSYTAPILYAAAAVMVSKGGSIQAIVDIVPASHSVEDCVDFPANQIYMKAGRRLGGLLETLERHGRLEGAMAVSNCGMEEERVWPRAADMDPESRYFSVLFTPGKDRD